MQGKKSNLILDQYLKVVSGNCSSVRISAHTIPFHFAFMWCKSGITFQMLDCTEGEEILALLTLCSMLIYNIYVSCTIYYKIHHLYL